MSSALSSFLVQAARTVGNNDASPEDRAAAQSVIDAAVNLNIGDEVIIYTVTLHVRGTLIAWNIGDDSPFSGVTLAASSIIYDVGEASTFKTGKHTTADPIPDSAVTRIKGDVIVFMFRAGGN